MSNKHYKQGAMETIDKMNMVFSFLSDNGLTPQQYFALGNAMKYFDRMGLKDSSIDDAYKCADYLHMAIFGDFLNRKK